MNGDINCTHCGQAQSAAASLTCATCAQLLQGALTAQDRREQEAGKACGVLWEEHGCDWPMAVAEKVIALRALLTELRRTHE